MADGTLVMGAFARAASGTGKSALSFGMTGCSIYSPFVRRRCGR